MNSFGQKASVKNMELENPTTFWHRSVEPQATLDIQHQLLWRGKDMSFVGAFPSFNGSVLEPTGNVNFRICHVEEDTIVSGKERDKKMG